MIKNGDSQCGTLCRIGTGTKLVEKYQRVGIHIFQDTHNGRHMGGKSTETLFNALLISDICKDIVKDAEFGTFKGRDMKSGLSHQGKESNRFQRNRLATGVWSGDDQKTEIISQTDGDRDYFFRIQKGMTTFFDADPALVIEDWTDCVHLLSQNGFCKNEIQLYENVIVTGNLVCICSCFFA